MSTTHELPRAQLAVLEAASADEPRPVAEVATEVDLAVETVTGAAFELESEGLLEVTEETEATAELTEEGQRYAEEGLPELRLRTAAWQADAEESPVELGALLDEAGLGGEAVDIALSNFARKGYGSIDGGEVSLAADSPATVEDPEERALSALVDGDDVEADALDALERRNLVERRERTARSIRLTEDGVTALMEGVEATGGVGQLTPEMLTSGAWRDAEFGEYNVAADAEDPPQGRVHPLRQMAERVKEVLVGMGFEEMAGPHVDADFYINDCLFTPQDHPARTQWDRFALEEPATMGELPADLVERVKRAQLEGVGEDGEGYHAPWSEDVARSLALRGHTTSLTARHLAGIAAGDLEPPQRYFSVEKAYRNDTLDATHLLEFFQIEGWVMAEELSVPELMGTFEEFYGHFGIEDLRFKPTYNPYTEPSFELFGRHPETDELIEIGNSGLFRPEMLEPLGVEADVMAWGLALERLMMLVTGAEDIRDVHGTLVDLEYLRTEEVVY
jgi:phenylalanyl-tRNA synthetase alpha chain